MTGTPNLVVDYLVELFISGILQLLLLPHPGLYPLLFEPVLVLIAGESLLYRTDSEFKHFRYQWKFF